MGDQGLLSREFGDVCFGGIVVPPSRSASYLLTGLTEIFSAAAQRVFGETDLDHALPALPDGLDEDLLLQKAQRLIHPYEIGHIFTENDVRGAAHLTVSDIDGNELVFREVHSVDNPETGFVGKIFFNDAHNHALVVYSGMDGHRDPESVPKDIESYMQAYAGHANAQALEAQELYLHAAEMAGSVEIMAHSMGTIHLDTAAARFGAVGTNIADMGLPAAVHTSQLLHYGEHYSQKIADNVTSYNIPTDRPPQMDFLRGVYEMTGIGNPDGMLYAGPVHATQVTLPTPAHEDILAELAKHDSAQAAYFSADGPCGGAGADHIVVAYKVAFDELKALELAAKNEELDGERSVAHGDLRHGDGNMIKASHAFP